jgi:very-short-patch-repair endonuclease
MLTKRNSTKVERKIANALIENAIPFRYKVLIKGRETDFIIADKIILEVDGIVHRELQKQVKDASKVSLLAGEGYRIFLRVSADEVRKNINQIIKTIKRLC